MRFHVKANHELAKLVSATCRAKGTLVYNGGRLGGWRTVCNKI